MTDLTQTAANVQSGNGATLQRKDAAETITAGESVYVDSNNQLALCENDNSAVEANAGGIAVNGGAAGQPVTYQTGGRINVGAALVAGETYVIGAVFGAIAPVADVAASEFSTILGIAISTSELEMSLNASGIAHG